MNIVTNSGSTRKKRDVYFHRELEKATHEVVEPGRREHGAQINEARECTSRELTHKPQYTHRSLVAPWSPNVTALTNIGPSNTKCIARWAPVRLD